MTNEQWAFCAGLSTGTSIFVLGMVVGAIIWHRFIVLWSERQHQLTREHNDKFYSQMKDFSKSNKDADK